MKSILILGAGNARNKRLSESCDSFYRYTPHAEETVHTVDIDKQTRPDFVHDLAMMPWPLKRTEYDEIHAYEVLEHFGAQGDFRALFAHFGQLWWTLKEGGKLYASVPAGRWAWGDPGHTRFITLETLTFLFREEYQKQVGITAMTDYRDYLVGDWELVKYHQDPLGLRFILRAK